MANEILDEITSIPDFTNSPAATSELFNNIWEHVNGQLNAIRDSLKLASDEDIIDGEPKRLIDAALLKYWVGGYNSEELVDLNAATEHGVFNVATDASNIPSKSYGVSWTHEGGQLVVSKPVRIDNGGKGEPDSYFIYQILTSVRIPTNGSARIEPFYRVSDIATEADAISGAFTFNNYEWVQSSTKNNHSEVIWSGTTTFLDLADMPSGALSYGLYMVKGQLSLSNRSILFYYSSDSYKAVIQADQDYVYAVDCTSSILTITQTNMDTGNTAPVNIIKLERII